MISNVCEGANIVVPDMAAQGAHFEPVAWWWARKQIGRDLKERYEVPKDLPPELLTLVRKLDAVEGNQLRLTGVKAFPDGFVLT